MFHESWVWKRIGSIRHNYFPSAIDKVEKNRIYLAIGAVSSLLSELTDDLDGINQVFDHIIVVGGGNDCSKKDTTTTEISASMATLLAKANEKATKVTVASVLPRPREPEIQIKMDHVNDSIKKLCKEKPAYNFVNNDGAFKLSDLSPNEAFYTEDGVHISYHGSQKLVSNLGIKDMCYIKTSPNYNKKQPGNDNRWQHRSRNNRQDISCYTCGEPGHVARTCRLQQKIRCFSCGTLGHKSNRCTRAEVQYPSYQTYRPRYT